VFSGLDISWVRRHRGPSRGDSPKVPHRFIPSHL
ncbi:unnamed protein product, partial [Gulo gulo]